MVVTILEFCSCEFALQNSVILLFVSIVVSVETKRRHYFRSDIYMIFLTCGFNEKTVDFTGVSLWLRMRQLHLRPCICFYCMLNLPPVEFLEFKKLCMRPI